MPSASIATRQPTRRQTTRARGGPEPLLPSETHQQGGRSSLQLAAFPGAEPQSGCPGAPSNKVSAWQQQPLPVPTKQGRGGTMLPAPLWKIQGWQANREGRFEATGREMSRRARSCCGLEQQVEPAPSEISALVYFAFPYCS